MCSWILLSDEEEDELSARSEDCGILFDRERRLLVRERGAFRSSSVEEPFVSVAAWSRSFHRSRPRISRDVVLFERVRLRSVDRVD